jgi:hypothetical protein
MSLRTRLITSQVMLRWSVSYVTLARATTYQIKMCSHEVTKSSIGDLLRVNAIKLLPRPMCCLVALS